MRGLRVALLVGCLLTLTVAATATGSGNYKDRFESGTWSGSDGSVEWSTSWERQGNAITLASGSGCSGACMKMSSLTTLLQKLRATRGADTSIFDGDFSLRYRLKAGASLLGGALVVMVRADGGAWDTVKTHNLGSGIDESPTIGVDQAFRSEAFEVRFEYSGVLLGSPAYIDDVELEGALAEEETTTTTTTSTTTTTTSSTTTTTTAPTTTTTAAPATTTTKPATTTTTTRSETTTSTIAPPVTTTIPAEPTTTTGSGDQGRGDGSTIGTTTSTSTTTTTIAATGAGPGSGSGGDGTTPAGSGIRAAARGLQASFQGDLYGEVRTVSIAGIDFEADYNMAVEVIEASWGWIVLLGLVVAYSMITGLERRRGEIDT